MKTVYLQPEDHGVIAMLKRAMTGPVLMLNLIKLKDEADYSTNPELAPEIPVSGREALQNYVEHTLPYLRQGGGDIVLLAEGGEFVIGPQDQHWDVVMIIKQNSVDDFLSFAQNQGYAQGLGHRVAAVEDSRLLPMQEVSGF